MGILAPQAFRDEQRAPGPCRAARVPELDGLAGERHFTPHEIAVLWGLSESKIRRLFAAEPGVIRLGLPSRRVGRRLKRSYFTMRVPASVAERVHRRLTGQLVPGRLGSRLRSAWPPPRRVSIACEKTRAEIPGTAAGRVLTK